MTSLPSALSEHLGQRIRPNLSDAAQDDALRSHCADAHCRSITSTTVLNYRKLADARKILSSLEDRGRSRRIACELLPRLSACRDLLVKIPSRSAGKKPRLASS